MQMEFHIARVFRDRFDLSELLFSYTGNVIFGNVAASRRLAKEMNDVRVAMGGPTAEESPESVIHAGQLFAMGLIDELSHAVIAQYRAEQDPALLSDALKFFAERTGEKELDALLLAFADRFPNVDVYSGRLTAKQWLDGATDGMTHREAALEELMLLWLANSNPAFTPFRALFDDTALQNGQPAYRAFVADADAYFETRPEFSPEAKTLLQALRAPALASPESLSGQLDYIREKWAPVLGPELKKALLAIATLREEEVAIWMQFNPRNVRHHGRGLEADGGRAGFRGDEYVGFEDGYEDVVGADGVTVRRRRTGGGAAGSQYAADYQAPLNEYEAFSSDDAWMPTVVLMAKSTYVWLEQLSKKYGRRIHRLDHVPVEELQHLRNHGMTGLWLIGLWERSKASQTIKHLRGQGDAVASAYSLMDYRIADDLGGNEAYQVLRDKAASVGLRLASDMVPNHMGIDSWWVTEHPEWFVRREHSPFPVYSFNGPDLSQDPKVEIKIEDHYYDQTDAAVVFQMRQRGGDGRTEYIYHGNDGTTFAWNDTAQLDYSQASVREHVIQVILQVARQFPIIRFDAAMVLAKRHVQRLWFPLPGVSGCIPSRAEDAMTQEEFDRIMPLEFWREVVDRVQQEVPGTLLLAEAFWLLESYFVRTLGMHRVYNSAFMVMLRDEENAKYRSYLKKTIEFDPDILKRYVNFMSNPDERTAIDQFGSGDKYFGVATMLATIPGLPMFGHGQIEGFTEKYGMEFKTAKMDERPNDALVARYVHEIAPLLQNRALFAESEHFVMYDYWTEQGTVDENVFAYSNRLGDERALILYNNRYESTRGTVHISAASMNKWTGELQQRSLGDALAIPSGDDVFVAYRDATRDLEFLRRANDLRWSGFATDLRGYQYIVLLHWRVLRATAEQPWDQLNDALRGAGVHRLDEAVTRLRLQPLAGALRAAVDAEALRSVRAGDLGAWAQRATPVFWRVAELRGESHTTDGGYADRLATEAKRVADAVGVAESSKALPPNLHVEAVWAPLLVIAVLRALPTMGTVIMDEPGLKSTLAEIFSELGIAGEDAWRSVARVRLVLSSLRTEDAAFWSEGDVQWLAGVNAHEGAQYLNHEALEQLMAFLRMAGGNEDSTKVLAAAKAADYRLDVTVAALTVPAKTSKSAKAPAVTKPVPAKKTTAAKKATPVKKGKPAMAAKPVKKPVASAIAEAAVVKKPVQTGEPHSIDVAAIPDVFVEEPVKTKAAKKSAAKKSNAKYGAKPKTPPM